MLGQFLTSFFQFEFGVSDSSICCCCCCCFAPSWELVEVYRRKKFEAIDAAVEAPDVCPIDDGNGVELKMGPAPAKLIRWPFTGLPGVEVDGAVAAGF